MGSPEDFLLAAYQLPSGIEAFDRSAVSRLYYCVFHEARAFISPRLGNPDDLFGKQAKDRTIKYAGYSVRSIPTPAICCGGSRSGVFDSTTGSKRPGLLTSGPRR
jgi:hypothetical protein